MSLTSDSSASGPTGLDLAPERKVYLKTFGCQMNVYDSERIQEMLKCGGYVETAQPDDADLIILNTCHIREKAAEKVYSDLGRIRDIKIERRAQGRDTQVAVAGCVAQAEGAEISRRAPVVDVVIGPQSYHRLPEFLARARTEGRAQIATDFPEDDKFSNLPARQQTGARPRNVTAFLTVQEGCDKFCTFCVVPYTRGAEYSRPGGDLIAEARRLVEQGVRELTLLGQNVNAYLGAGANGGRWSLAQLLGELAEINGLERLRYTTSHPRDMGDDLIDAHRSNAKLMPYLHLPFQSGADRILAAMNRKHTAAEYLALIARIRKARPDIALSTDIIVGFPGETEADFEATLAIVRAVGFAQSYSFRYSARPGTPAATMGDAVPDDVGSARLIKLQRLLEANQTAFNSSCVGRVLPVLFEKPGRNSGQLIGRSPYLQSVHAEASPQLLGRIIPVEISAVMTNSLTGVIKAA